MIGLLDWIDEKKLLSFALCLNPNAIQYLKEHPHLINYDYLSYNQNAYELLIQNPDNICASNFAFNTHPETANIIKHKRVKYWKNICQNPSLIQLIKENPDKIHWDSLSRNPAAISMLKLHFDKIVWAEFCLNTSPEAIEIIKANPDKIDWFTLSVNPSAIKYLEKHPDKINYWALSWNTAAIHLIESNMDKIHWMGLSSNSSAMHILKRNQSKIDWVQFSTNPGIFDYNYQTLAIERTNTFREELMMNALHPRRIQKMLDSGMDLEDI
jgi:hypothetical protein